MLEEIGYWSEIKHAIIGEYAKAYSTILSKQPLYHMYVDAFAGSGQHISKSTQTVVRGSPLIALDVQPSFKEYHFIDLDAQKIKRLYQIAGKRGDVHIYEGDCNKILLEEIFPIARWEDSRRALVLLDPYGLHLNWEVIETAGRMHSIEIFLNFPLHDMNRNVLWHDLEKADPRDVARMTAFWGDDSWREAVYETQGNLFGGSASVKDASSNRKMGRAFRKRLTEVANFKYVPAPILMRNMVGGPLYYLFFASNNSTGAKIARYIFDQYQKRGI